MCENNVADPHRAFRTVRSAHCNDPLTRIVIPSRSCRRRRRPNVEVECISVKF